MVDQFVETTVTGYGSRIGNSIKGIAAGIILFLGSFGLLYFNEGRVDLSTIAQTATEISARSINTDPSLGGKLVFVTDVLDSNEIIGDNLFLNPDKFIATSRTVEMYSWQEESESKSKTNTGGSETTDTTYTYVKDWVEGPQRSSGFKYPEGHENPQKTLESFLNKVQNATIGVYQVDMSSVMLPVFTKVQLNQQNITLTKDVILANDSYIFISQDKESTFANPKIGDLRVSYSVLYPGKTVTIFGKLNGDNISPYFDEDNNQLYHIFSGTRDEAISTLHSEYTLMLWILRLVGLLMMWIGLSLLFDPISVLLSFLPIFGILSKSTISIVALLVSLVLTIITIIVSMIIHSLIALVIALVIVIALIIFVVMKIKKRKQSSQVTPPLPPTGTVS
jgi:hypothetical protein